MAYVQITIHLTGGRERTGVRASPSPINLQDIRMHAWQLSAEVLGPAAILEVTVVELPADHPAVVAFILGEQRKKVVTPASDGEHPYVKQQHRRPPR